MKKGAKRDSMTSTKTVSLLIHCWNGVLGGKQQQTLTLAMHRGPQYTLFYLVSDLICFKLSLVLFVCFLLILFA